MSRIDSSPAAAAGRQSAGGAEDEESLPQAQRGCEGCGRQGRRVRVLAGAAQCVKRKQGKRGGHRGDDRKMQERDDAAAVPCCSHQSFNRRGSAASSRPRLGAGKGRRRWRLPVGCGQSSLAHAGTSTNCDPFVVRMRSAGHGLLSMPKLSAPSTTTCTCGRTIAPMATR